MKKLITNINGGMPDLLDNFRWMEAGMVEAIEGICKGLARGRSTFRLWGAIAQRITSAVVSVSPGMIYHNGEIFNVEQQSFVASHDHVLYWESTDHYHSSGLLTFQNGQQHNVYLDRRMILKHAPTPPAGALLDSQLLSLNQLLDDNPIVSGNLTLPAGFIALDISHPPRWNRRADGTVFMTGAVFNQVVTSVPLNFTINIPSNVVLNLNTGNSAKFLLPAIYRWGSSFADVVVDKLGRRMNFATHDNVIEVSLDPIILH